MLTIGVIIIKNFVYFTTRIRIIWILCQKTKAWLTNKTFSITKIEKNINAFMDYQKK